MRRNSQVLTLLLISAMLLSACTLFPQTDRKGTSSSQILEEKEAEMPTQLRLVSSVFRHGQTIPKRYTCDGENLSPPFMIEEIPPGTESLVLTVEDPDAPSGNWAHWLVWNIPPQFNEIPEGSPPPSAIQGKNDFGEENWGGPCPPPGPEHRYFFRLYALDTILELSRGAAKPVLEKAMEGHIIAQAELMGRYGRGR